MADPEPEDQLMEWLANWWVFRGLLRQFRLDFDDALIIIPLGRTDQETNRMSDEMQRFPDAENCRTRYLGPILGLSECLVESLDRCPYALKFATDYFCRHPGRKNFETPSQKLN